MEHRLELDLHAQPNDITCGPTCLHAVYRYWGIDRPLEQVIAETPTLEEGGTLAVHLARHALRRGFRARIHVFNLRLFDPTWFDQPGGLAEPERLAEKLRAQRSAKTRGKLRTAIDAYLDYLDLGGEVAMVDLTTDLLRHYLNRSIPLLTGLSSTYLYRCAREIDAGPTNLEYDDVRGEPTGHFVILAGYDRAVRTVLVADPLHPGMATSPPPGHPGRFYTVDIHRLICAILIGIITYDGNILALQPDPQRERSAR